MINTVFQSRLYRAIIYSVLIVMLGVTGYMLLFDYSFINALYMKYILLCVVNCMLSVYLVFTCGEASRSISDAFLLLLLLTLDNS